ncbi:MAG: UDP-N-acetylglucosamine 1-carboxyvinyltransferase [Bacillota bacterium]|jgi:UDP-N-acetylglucosamine 1-carboxyvinyltransferase|nr:UDP-N-acetylglucosamine 1-carboxyvinyltransferase [Bacillota bacterium]MDK2854917.1 UDP-N-acetylglucosamine 1-carboxyvinyltransferase [Bacillota bacterium]MDK2924230.1 UDP-N-acetylglucosamine 1-carboxyvinyltransferase [Bacillota bacterium]
MEKLVIEGGRALNGSVVASGAKNSALPLLVAAALSEEESILENVPQDTDVEVMCSILRALGARVTSDAPGRVRVSGAGLKEPQAPYELVRRMRASFYVAGLLLGRLGRAVVALPGGCSIGSRPVDYHIKGFEALGAKVSLEHGFMKAEAPRLTGAKYYVGRASVGATINTMLAAVLAEGTTILENAAREPEVVDVANFLNSMGARIKGAGMDVIRIEGVRKLHGAEHEIIPDRIEAGSYLILGAVAGGEVTVENAIAEHLRALLSSLEAIGVEVKESTTAITVKKKEPLAPLNVVTQPYPGFPTDLQAPLAVLLTQADGVSTLRETIFDGRFKYVDELRRMGADIKVERDTAIITGPVKLTGAPVEATDLRGGMALVIAALAAEGRSEVTGLEHIDRGYEHLTAKLQALGAKVERVGS